jgi:hypothetical protein
MAFAGKGEEWMLYPYLGDHAKILCGALDIATRYLVLRGYDRSEAQERAARHIGKLFNAGETRSLMLANLAIAAVERDPRTPPTLTIYASSVRDRA